VNNWGTYLGHRCREIGWYECASGIQSRSCMFLSFSFSQIVSRFSASGTGGSKYFMIHYEKIISFC